MIVVAGHVCLDVIPAMETEADLVPGTLVEVGSATFASGGAVANVGLTLAKLGAQPALAGRIGADPFGAVLRDRLAAEAGRAAESSAGGATSATDTTLSGIVTAAGESTSYSVVISPRGRDRIFLHHAGCNDTFSPEDLQPDRPSGATILHVGYPPLMRATYEDGGAALAAAFGRFRAHGVATSLDMAYPDPHGAAGRVDWRAFLERVLPEVDLFLPSWSETCVILGRAEPRAAPSPEDVARVADELLGLGPALVGLKLGDDGLYVRTAQEARCRHVGRDGLPEGWGDRELWSPNFEVEVHGTTGAGDATIGGLLAALERRLAVEDALTMAAAAGASAVEGIDAVGAVRPWDALQERIATGWKRRAGPRGWRAGRGGVLRGPRDALGGR